MKFTLLTPLAMSLLLAAPAAWCDTHDLLIRNGKIYDGTGNAWFYGDIAVDQGRISRVGDLSDAEAEEVIDAAGMAVAPGFIDVHAHADSGVLQQPQARNFIRNGVTTIINGNCGGSADDVAEKFAKLSEQGVALNVATLFGHNTILRNTKGNKAGALTDAQWDEAIAMVRKAMEDGAVGMSTGLIYTPGTYSDTEEIIRLQKVVAEYGGIYASHMRSEAGGILDAIDEAIRIGEETGSRVQISHFKMPSDVEIRIGGSDTTLRRVYEARERGLEVWIDQYPYTASSTGLSVLFPDWVLAEGREKANEILQDEEQLELVFAEMRASHEQGRLRKDFDFARIASSRAYPEYSGLSIKEVAQILKYEEENGVKLDPKNLDKSILPEVTMDEQYRLIADMQVKGSASMVYHTMNESQVENIMKSPLVAVASDSGVRTFGEGVPHPRGYGTNSRVLGRYVRERGIITLEDAIRKMTSMPARAFRIEDRGLLFEGNWADIVIFDPETVTDHATFENPHQYATGFKYVLVNGVPVVIDDNVVGNLPGMPIHGPGWTGKTETKKTATGG